MELKMRDNEFIVSKTDCSGNIIYGNRTFIEISGYSENELLKAPHNILRHSDMPSIIFKLLWERISGGEGIYAYVKNLSKNSDFYWVFAYVTPSFDENGKIIGYYSVRRKPTQEAINTIAPIYKQLLNSEKNSGIQASQELLNSLLQEKGINYDKFILSLQK